MMQDSDEQCPLPVSKEVSESDQQARTEDKSHYRKSAKYLEADDNRRFRNSRFGGSVSSSCLEREVVVSTQKAEIIVGYITLVE
jgi:hypothetical protein